MAVGQARRSTSGVADAEAAAVAPIMPAWARRAGIAALAAVYIFVWGLSGLVPINETDLDAFFLPSARIALGGHPFLAYTLRYDVSYPNANGPLSLLPLTAIAALAAHVGWLDIATLRRMLVMAAFSVFPLLLAWEGVAAVDRVRGAALRGWARLFAYALFALAPLLWHGALLYGHIEQPLMLWLALLSVRLLAEDRPAWSGVAMGLSLLTRSNALLYLIALLVLLAARGRWGTAARLGGVAGLTVALGLLPFYVAAPHDLLFSLVTFRAALPVAGGTLWGLVVGTPYEPFAQRFDTWTVLGAGLLLSAAVALARRDLTPRGRDVYGLLALAAVCFPLLIKTLWPYYFLDAYMLTGIWWLAAPGAWAARNWWGVALPAYFEACAIFAEYGTGFDIGTADRWRESLTLTVALVAFILAFGARLLAGGRQGRAEAVGAPVGAPAAAAGRGALADPAPE